MNTTPFNENGTLKKYFFRGAAGGLRTMHKQLTTWHTRYATLMKLESTSVSLMDQINNMLRVVEQLEIDQDADAKSQKASDERLRAAGFPKKQSNFEKLYRKSNLLKRKGKR